MNRPTALHLLRVQFRYHNLLFWRSPVAAFFTLILPLVTLLLFMALFGDATGGAFSAADFYVPGLAVFAAVSASYTNLAITTAMARDAGILKRVKGTPLPTWIYMAGKVASAVWVAGIAVAVMMTVGVIVYGFDLRPASLGVAGSVFVVGVGCFAACGLMMAALAPTGDSTPALTNATLLPLAFISDIFFPVEQAPRWMQALAQVFPLEAFAGGFRTAVNGTMPWRDVGFMMLWGVGAAAVAARRFRWEPGRSRRAAYHRTR
ncbi:MAG: transport permease protein [Acidimicrobiia bacterium]|nr:MAG: transport permease protein [Acidimicrobiia bacterium]